MMNNLFSIFDTSTNTLIELNWLSSFLIILFLPTIFWLLSNRFLMFFKKILFLIFKEFKIILVNKFNYLNSIFFTALLMFIFFNNFMGLFPYIFTSSSHLIFAMSFSLPLWLSFMIFGWYFNTNFMFSHLIPSGTPILLMPFMVLIESISNFIRSGTLAIRLTANMIAGHLLLTLMSESAISPIFWILTLIIIFLQTILVTLEVSVSAIQSYVFSILSTLYSKETN